MARYDTGSQVPSSAIPDMNDNLLFLDDWANKPSGTAISRKGVAVPVLQEQVNVRIDGLTETANKAVESASQSAAASDNSATAAEAARNEAAAYAETAQSGFAVTGKNVYPDIASGLAATAEGEYFQVPQGIGAAISFITYRNASGQATQVADWPGKKALDDAISSNDATNNRTAGLRTTEVSKNPYEMVTAEGRAVMWLDENGGWHFPGGISASSLDLLSLIASTVEARSVTVGKGSITPGAGKYLYAETDKAGRVLFGTLQDGSKQYLGYPLKNHAGLMRNDFFFIGDSITAFTHSASGVYSSLVRSERPAVCSQGWPVWAELLSSGRIKYAGVSATGGYRADQILATHVPVAIAAKPTFCVVLAGRNNVVQNYTLESTISSMRKIYETLRKAGIIPVCCSMSAQSGNTAAQDTLRYALNDWIRAYAEKNSLPFVDMHSVTTDPATGVWYAGWNYDVSHPNGTGAKAMGRALVAAMSDWVGNIKPRMAESNTASATSTNLIDNPLFTVTTDGSNADGWNIINAGVSSLDDSTDVKGKAWTLVAGSDAVKARRAKTISVTEGMRLGLGFFFRQNADSDPTYTFGSTNGNYVYVVSGSDETAKTYLSGIRRWMVKTDGFGYFYDEFVVPAGVSNVTVVLWGENMTVAQLGLFKITEI